MNLLAKFNLILLAILGGSGAGIAWYAHGYLHVGFPADMGEFVEEAACLACSVSAPTVERWLARGEWLPAASCCTRE